jgi:hypothetical protein
MPKKKIRTYQDYRELGSELNVGSRLATMPITGVSTTGGTILPSGVHGHGMRGGSTMLQ